MSTENLEHREALKKLKELADDIKTCMLATNLEYLPLNVRPMQTLQVDDTGNIWFFNSRDSLQYTDIQQDNRVQLMYGHPGKTEFLSIYGTAHISRDQDKIDELWHPMVKAWFEGKDDPNLMLLRVSPQDAYYWDTKYNKLISLFKIAAATVSGHSTDDGVKGRIKI